MAAMNASDIVKTVRVGSRKSQVWCFTHVFRTRLECTRPTIDCTAAVWLDRVRSLNAGDILPKNVLNTNTMFCSLFRLDSCIFLYISKIFSIVVLFALSA